MKSSLWRLIPGGCLALLCACTASLSEPAGTGGAAGNGAAGIGTTGGAGGSSSAGVGGGGSVGGSGGAAAPDADVSTIGSGGSGGSSVIQDSGSSTGGSMSDGPPRADGAAGGAGAGVDAGGSPFKGLALSESTATCADIGTLTLSWYYNWTTRTSCRGTAEFIPQIWGHPNEAIATEISAIAAAGYKTVLGFNEPSQPGQSPYTVAQAIMLWPQLTANPALRVGSPATSASADGQAWFIDFMTQAVQQNLRIDFIALHWYGWNAGSCDAAASQLEGYINWAETRWPNYPIWITEWGCLFMSAPAAEGVKAFYDGALRVFAKPNRHIERYGWFLSRNSDNTALMSTAGVVTPLGADYAIAPTFR